MPDCERVLLQFNTTAWGNPKGAVTGYGDCCPQSRTGFSLSITSTSAAFMNREVALATSLLCASSSSSLASPQMKKQTISQNLQRAPQRRLTAGPEASPSGDINVDRDRAIDLEVSVQPPLHHAAAGLALEERRSRRECSHLLGRRSAEARRAYAISTF